jgi:hypothetical protein
MLRDGHQPEFSVKIGEAVLARRLAVVWTWYALGGFIEP